MTERTGSIECGGDDPRALLVSAWVYKGFRWRPLQRLLQLVARQGEQSRNIRGVSRLMCGQQADDQGSGGLAEEEVGSALTEGVGRVGN
jgi:hypothetical protein